MGRYVSLMVLVELTPVDLRGCVETSFYSTHVGWLSLHVTPFNETHPFLCVFVQCGKPVGAPAFNCLH